MAGCIGRPFSDGAALDRPSIYIPPQEFDGELITTNGTMLLSVVPAALASVYSPDQPLNCFILRSANGAESYLGGAIVDLAWTPATPATQRLRVSLGAGDHWTNESASPMHFVQPADDTHVLRTPITVSVTPAGDPLPFADQRVTFGVTLGILESQIPSFDVVQCGALPLPT